MWILRGILFAISLHLIASFGVPFNGQCPEIELLNEFDLDQYMGMWYSYQKYPFGPSSNRRCVYAHYTNLHNNTISVTNGGIREDTGAPSNTTGYAVVRGPGQLAVIFSSRQNADTTNYIVLGTDYSSYAVVYNCRNVNATSYTKDAFILTRTRTPNENAVALAKSTLVKNKVDLDYLITTDQANCGSFPL